MSNPNAVDGGLAVLEAATTERSVALNRYREYTLRHDGEDATGSPNSSTVYLALNQAPSPDAAAGEDRFKLLAGSVVVIGPGVTTLRFRTASGAPTISVSAGPMIGR